MHPAYFTSATPTRQGLVATFTGHPNAALLSVGLAENSFVHRLVAAGFSTTFIKGDSAYYSPESALLRQLGFQDVLAKEQLVDDADARAHSRGTGVADYFVYAALRRALAAPSENKRFIAVLGVDTHPGQRENYDDLGYPAPDPALAAFGAAADALQQLSWHDYDMAKLLSWLRASPIWREDFLLVLTADHCRPFAHELSAVPGYTRDALCRVPLAFLTPQQLPPMAPEIASQVDLGATLMQLLDLPPLSGTWGQSVFRTDKDNPAVGVIAHQLYLRHSDSEWRLIDWDRADAARALDFVNTFSLEGERAQPLKP
jgi:phosphoglycerol transferase MdoB-like AlkP superfamily enzyme